jgi:hypothetical protein
MRVVVGDDGGDRAATRIAAGFAGGRQPAACLGAIVPVGGRPSPPHRLRRRCRRVDDRLSEQERDE